MSADVKMANVDAIGADRTQERQRQLERQDMAIYDLLDRGHVARG